MKIPFSPPFIDDDVKREVLETLESGWITSGPRVAALELLVAEQTGVAHAVCCNSATSGLMLMLHWFGIGKGDEVIIPAYTYAATALAVIHVGATPVMVDSGDDFNLDVAAVREKITERTKAIIPVDIAGWPCDFQSLRELVEDDDIRRLFKANGFNQRQLGRVMLLSDAAHSIGASYMQKPTGNWADFTVFSFHAVKNVTTAEGGAIVLNLAGDRFNSMEVYKELKLWSLNGQTKDAFSKTTGGGWRYDIVYPGFKFNMPDVLAAIGLAQLRKYTKEILPERKRVFEAYCNSFKSIRWAKLPQADSREKTSSYHLFPLRIIGISEHQRDAIIQKITEQGVSVNVHFQPLPMLTVFREMGFRREDYPKAFSNYECEISLPIYPELDRVKIDYIVSSVVTAYESVLND